MSAWFQHILNNRNASPNQRLHGITFPQSAHFPQQFPKVSLRFRAIPTPRPIIVDSRVPVKPDVTQSRDRLLNIGFPLAPADIGFPLQEDDVWFPYRRDDISFPIPPEDVEVDQGRLDNEEQMRENRTGSVALVLALSVITTFSVDDVVGFLKPLFIGFAPDVAWFIWVRWGPLLVLKVVDRFFPWLSPVVISFICLLPPTYIVALLPPDWIALLPPSTIERLPRSCIERLPPSCIETLSPSCIEMLSSSCIQTLSPSFIARLPRSDIDSLSLHPGTHIQVQLIALQCMVDEISLRVAALMPSVPVPFVIFAMRFGISFGFWSLSLALWRLLRKFG